MRRAFGYGRVSGHKQADSGMGEEGQRQRNRQTYDRLLAHEGYEWAGHFFDPGVSADRVHFSRRPEAERLLQTLEAGDAVVVYDITRLARRTRDALEVYDLLEARGVRLVVGQMSIDTGNPMVKAMFRMMAVFAELDTDFIKMRNRSKVAALKAGGYWAGGTPPYGYKPIRGDRHALLVPDLVQRALTRRVMSWMKSYGGAYSTGEVARHLNDNGHYLQERRRKRHEKERGRRALGEHTEHSVRRMVRAELRLVELEAAAGVDNRSVFLIPGRGAVEFAKLPPVARRSISEQAEVLAKSAQPGLASAGDGR